RMTLVPLHSTSQSGVKSRSKEHAHSQWVTPQLTLPLIERSLRLTSRFPMATQLRVDPPVDSVPSFEPRENYCINWLLASFPEKRHDCCTQPEGAKVNLSDRVAPAARFQNRT